MAMEVGPLLRYMVGLGGVAERYYSGYRGAAGGSSALN